MSRTTTVRTYGRKTTKRTKPVLFAELPTSPTPTENKTKLKPIDNTDDIVSELTEKLDFVTLDEKNDSPEPQRGLRRSTRNRTSTRSKTTETPQKLAEQPPKAEPSVPDPLHDDSIDSGLRALSWADVCPSGDRIEKIAEASYAEVYRVSNAHGTSIIKAIRLASPIRAQTKAQVRSGLVDEEPHDEEDLRGELTISEMLADIPGFVVYKERYIVQGKTTKELLETHQLFHRRAKRHDPDRLQFYPSPSRYLEDTRFLVIELGDAGKALEDVVLESVWQLWDVFLHVAIALARAEDLIQFEHRDLHEGNLCIRQVSEPHEKTADDDEDVVFGYSGLDITILDYGLSRADGHNGQEEPVAFDLEKDLSLFTSTHAAQCKVYRQMRSYLLKGDRVHLPPSCHQQPYDEGPEGQAISWKEYHPYTNVLWLAYLYSYLVQNFHGSRSSTSSSSKRDVATFQETSQELWQHLDPDAAPGVLSFACATDVVRFALEAGWLTEEQLVGEGGGAEGDSFLSVRGRGNDSIIEPEIARDPELRRSPRRRVVDYRC